MTPALNPRRTPSPSPASRLERHRLSLDDGLGTTLHVARYPRDRAGASLVAFPRPRRLVEWCRENQVRHAIVAGFFVRPEGRPLGELRVDGVARDHEPFAPPWGGRRGCVAVQEGRVEIALRPALPSAPAGDLLEAGPILVRNGRSVVDGVEDPEGFSSHSEQFDSDITNGRYPRAALGTSGRELIVVACEGRAAEEAGLTLSELARALVQLGSDRAINLDGGGSTSLIFGGILRNCPREEHGVRIAGGRPVATALAFFPSLSARRSATLR
ncbi:MAG TPA: phosphodiester glycosidase family protein [Solirubrobacterales bacterium]|nr:phosphodiester glycosidase family protein [Solirubrobacterales bacterium]